MIKRRKKKKVMNKGTFKLFEMARIGVLTNTTQSLKLFNQINKKLWTLNNKE